MYNCTDVLLSIGQPEVTAVFAGTYLRYIIPGVWAYCQTELLRRYLSTQGVFDLLLKVQLATTVLHCLWLYLFVGVLDFEVFGVAISTCITYILTYALAALYITWNKSVVKKDSWHCINADSFRGLVQYLQYGVPAMVMLILEFWCFEALMILAGYLGPNKQGASIILLNIAVFVFMIACGISLSTSSLVGNSLGALRPDNAKTYAKMSQVLS
mmetsp:Transcript_33746/g.38862  ORF Transcript_33746/g.38862 Transcript_33746/m.38862 type:complete len:213 (+) Transcript_33746:446-1084(+)